MMMIMMMYPTLVVDIFWRVKFLMPSYIVVKVFLGKPKLDKLTDSICIFHFSAVLVILPKTTSKFKCQKSSSIKNLK